MPPQAVPWKPWFPNQDIITNPQGLVLCFHNAGGDSAIFTTRYIARQPVGNELLDYCQARGFQCLAPLLPQRSFNYAQPLLGATVESLTLSILQHMQLAIPSLAALISQNPVFILGHSMGCIFAFEFTRLMLERFKAAPKLLFLSSSVSPALPPPARPWDPVSGLSDEDLRVSMPNWDMKAEGLQPRMWEVFGKLIRADMMLLDNYQPPSSRAVLESPLLSHCDLVLVRGADDRMITREHMEGWRACLPSAASCTYHVIPGGTHALYYDVATRKACFELFNGFMSTLVPVTASGGELDNAQEEEEEVYGF